MSIDRTVQGLINEIKLTREFKELKQAIKNLDKYKDIKEEIESLQKKQMELLSSNKSPREAKSNMKIIEQQFKSLSKHPNVNNMIKSKTSFNKMMNNIYEKINKALNSELNQ